MVFNLQKNGLIDGDKSGIAVFSVNKLKTLIDLP